MTPKRTQTQQPPATVAARPTITRAALASLPTTYELIAARFYRHSERRAAPIWIVIHATHGAEGVGKARDGALAMQRLPVTTPRDKQVSTHLFVDTGEVIQSVPFGHEAWHAGHTGNLYGIGIELCGSADQSRDQWFDAASLPMLGLAAAVVRRLSDELLIPLQYREGKELVDRVPGVTTHAAIAKAFPGETNHTDPGPSFPLAELLAAAST